MTKPFPEFVTLFARRDDSLGDFARYFTAIEPNESSYPTWAELRDDLTARGPVRGITDAGRKVWEAWSGEVARDDNDTDLDESETASTATNHDEDDEEWLDNETFRERLGREPAGSRPSTGYEDSNLDGWMTDGA